MPTDRCVSTSGQESGAKGITKEVLQECIHKHITNMEYARDNYTDHGDRKRGCKEKFGSYTRKTFNRFTISYCYAWNITNKI
jgi:hypothetical protein